ncbi:hypothetical protein HanRHA438_Chr13g0612751 [Helianthus annuus]|nr:hypothetical protein HanHA300_Chr13g0494391 [Helianthus annuus]KAJ0498753.1 hypothetical protein HanHA89_Chr13g0526511 [Helianthus annuus]KAJ0664774.1 hypothetical protein HanLR1_Chr13g0496591 [Helianthus annuus]KAJ0859445.1 hypothetical protein HanRHA438_Chr13g0612751 [Helianthus annuus]
MMPFFPFDQILQQHDSHSIRLYLFCPCCAFPPQFEGASTVRPKSSPQTCASFSLRNLSS